MKTGFLCYAQRARYILKIQVPQLRSLATALLAGAGIAGNGIGIAAKDPLSNFTSGIFIAVFQPFRVGDLVNFDSKTSLKKREFDIFKDFTHHSCSFLGA